MHEVLYIGKFIPQNLLSTVKEDSKGKIGFSNHNFEMSLIGGLRAQENINVTCLSIPSVYSYPHNNKRIWISSEHYEVNNAKIISTGYFNLSVVNIVCKIFSAFINILKIIRANKSNQIDIIVNTPATELLLPLHMAQLFSRKKIHKTLIIPDIPSFVSGMTKMNPLKKFFVRCLDKFSMSMASRCDSYVVLTEAMMEFLPANKRHIVMEGIVDVDTMNDENVPTNNSPKNILYTGTLRKIFGVMDLVDAFEKVNIPNVELRICGSGEASQEIIDRANKNPHIKFYGLIDGQDALRLQREATVLVNPRTSEGKFTKYSFPSKTMEYLLSGNPVVAHKLPGIPNEYNEFIQYPKTESISGLADKLNELLSLPQESLNLIGKKGRDFVISQKNSKVQMKRILEFMSNQ